MKVRDIMTKEVTIISAAQPITDVAHTMRQLDIGSLPVVQDGRLIGIITDRDIAIRGVAEGKGPDAKVREIMSKEVKYCFEDEDIDDVLENMGDLQVRRLPVLSREKRLVGIVSLGDLAGNEAEEAGEALSSISRPGGEHSQTQH